MLRQTPRASTTLKKAAVKLAVISPSCYGSRRGWVTSKLESKNCHLRQCCSKLELYAVIGDDSEADAAPATTSAVVNAIVRPGTQLQSQAGSKPKPKTPKDQAPLPRLVSYRLMLLDRPDLQLRFAGATSLLNINSLSDLNPL